MKLGNSSSQEQLNKRKHEDEETAANSKRPMLTHVSLRKKPIVLFTNVAKSDIDSLTQVC